MDYENIVKNQKYPKLQSNTNFSHCSDLPNEYLEYEFDHAELFALEFNDHPTKIFTGYCDKIDALTIERHL